jgi:hypothetical protein
MAVWEVRTVVQNGDRSWENVWHVDVGSATDVPPDLVDAFITFARNTLLDLYTVARVVRRPAGTTDEFIEVIVDAAGTIASSGFIALPLFNVVRVLLAGGVGRPGVKYLRGVLATAHIIDDNNTIASALLTAIQGELNTLFNAASDALCDIVFGASNKVAVSSDPDNIVHMRQQHRKRRRSA